MRRYAKRGYENIIHFWQHKRNGILHLQVPFAVFMQSKVNYYLILSPLSWN